MDILLNYCYIYYHSWNLDLSNMILLFFLFLFCGFCSLGIFLLPLPFAVFLTQNTNHTHDKQGEKHE